MTDLSQASVALAVLACAIIYGTDIFAAIVLRPALAMLDSETIINTMGRVHEIADRRMPVPGIVGLFAAVVGTVTAAIAGRWDPAVLATIAVASLVAWLAIYIRISAPINRQFAAAIHAGQVSLDARTLQGQWDRVINARSALQMLAITTLCAALIVP